MAKVLITTVPFGAHNQLPIDLLESLGVDFEINPIGRRLTESELVKMAARSEIIIAGTGAHHGPSNGCRTGSETHIESWNRARQRRPTCGP